MHFVTATADQADIVNNLLALYMHDMSEWFGMVPDSQGRFGFVVYDHFESGNPVYLAFEGDIPAGFALVARQGAGEYELEEFFLVRRYRHRRHGEAFTRHIWSALPGQWVIRVYEGNLPAVPFWHRSVAEFAPQYDVDTITREGFNWLSFRFDNSP